MPVNENVVYCKEGCVNMFSDASNFQLTGAKFKGDEVFWDIRFKVLLSDREKEASSTFRGMRVIEEGLRAHGNSLRKEDCQVGV